MRTFLIYVQGDNNQLLVKTELLNDGTIVVEYGTGYEELAGTKADDIFEQMSKAFVPSDRKKK